jgi:hypothetical protein
MLIGPSSRTASAAYSAGVWGARRNVSITAAG